MLANSFQAVEADVESSHEKDDVLKLRIRPNQFIAPAVQWLVSCGGGRLLAYMVWNIHRIIDGFD